MSFISQKLNIQISSESELRKVIPAYSKILDKRIIPELDQYCLEIIEHSTLVVWGTSDVQNKIAVIACSNIKIVDTKTIKLQVDEVSSAIDTAVAYASLYFLVPGVGHGLRVNGTMKFRQSLALLSITGAYVHCARAAVRSGLWDSALGDSLSSKALLMSDEGFLSESPYLFLKTMNKLNQTEISPRGDHAGFVKKIGSNSLFIPERPGNKVAVSLRNILQNEAVELLLLIPGSNQTMKVKGKASLTIDDELLNAATVDNKRPKIGIRIDCCVFTVQQYDVLVQSCQVSEHVHEKRLTKFSKVLSAHMNGEGLLGKATTPIIQAVVNHDMKNLY